MRQLIILPVLCITLFLAMPAQATRPLQQSPDQLVVETFDGIEFEDCALAFDDVYPAVQATTIGGDAFGPPRLSTTGQASGNGMECELFDGGALHLRFDRPLTALAFNRSGPVTIIAYRYNDEVLNEQRSGLGGRVEYRFPGTVDRVVLSESSGTRAGVLYIDDLSLTLRGQAFSTVQSFDAGDAGNLCSSAIKSGGIISPGEDSSARIAATGGCQLQPGESFSVNLAHLATTATVEVRSGAAEMVALEGDRALATTTIPITGVPTVLVLPTESRFPSIRITATDTSQPTVINNLIVTFTLDSRPPLVDFAAVPDGESCADAIAAQVAIQVESTGETPVVNAGRCAIQPGASISLTPTAELLAIDMLIEEDSEPLSLSTYHEDGGFLLPLQLIPDSSAISGQRVVLRWQVTLSPANSQPQNVTLSNSGTAATTGPLWIRQVVIIPEAALD